MDFFACCEHFHSCIEDLLNTEPVRRMESFVQHSDVSTLEHSVFVAFVSFVVCKKLHLNYHAAARGALLHDLFLYDWHLPENRGKLHGFKHPAAALKNADKFFHLTDIEKDIIAKHMWPITILPPRYVESLVVSMADKFCASCEVVGLNRQVWVRRILAIQEMERFSINDFKEILKDLESASANHSGSAVAE